MKFLDLLKEKIIVFDGAMGSNLQSLELTLDDWGGAEFENCSENLLYTRPDAIRTVHTSFLDVGCDVIETNSFGGSEVVLTEFGIADKTYDVNRKAAELAKELARDYSTKDKPRFVAGSIGPGTKLPTLGHITYRDLKDAYREQIRGLIDGGADIMMVETCQDLLQTKAALAAIFEHFEKHKIKLPVIASVTIEVFGTMLNGTEIGAALTALEPFPIDVIGMNCGTGPKHMADSFQFLCENSPIPVSVLPNAGLPEVKDGKQHYDETPESFAAQVEHFANDLGANIVGGCCGTSPEHLRLVVERLAGVSPKRRDAKLEPSASSIYFQQPYTQDASFLIVGERVNASGSKKMRDLLDAEDWDGLVNLAKSQEKEGAHILDVNVDFVGRDGVADMHELASRLVTNVKIPIMFDSTEWEKMEAGLEHAGGKSILNSTNYEDGEERFLKVLDLAKEYGAAVVIGLIDEEGMARAYDDKMRIARRAYKQVTEYGIPGHDIFFDPLALPISTGIEEDRKNADETIRAIRDIHAEMPDANIILGVSNISFGLSPAARVVLNSVFLHDCVEAGMNSAIVNASKILPLMRFSELEIETARDLIYDRRRWNADAPVRNERNADAPVRNERNADAPVCNEGEARTTAATFANKKGWHERGYLPHFDGVVTQFVTFRLADSLPQNVLMRLQAEIDAEKHEDAPKEYRKRVEEYLDSGIGECLLRRRDVAQIVKETLENGDGRDYKLISWVIMPNHIHVLLRPLEGKSLSAVMQSIKSVSSRKISKLLGRTGKVWQPDYFDRYIRDEEHFQKAVSYIENNPVKAGLCESPTEWEFSSAKEVSSADERVDSTEEADEGVRVPLICTYDPLTEFTKLFEGKTAASIKPDITNLPVEERLKEHIIEGEKIGLEDSLKEALEKYPPLDIINNILLDGMKVVGDLFGSGQMQLPFVLQSAEAMKAAVRFLEPFMEKVEGSNKGVMVLATVKGDVHDIGKNLVDIILTNNGYKVVNLGIKQNIDDILRAAEEHNCDAIGMSGLLVKSTLIMRDNLQIMNDRGIKTPVILGGAALNRRYVDNDLIPLFNGKLFYARDAFDGLHAMDELTTNGTAVQNIGASAQNVEASAQNVETSIQNVEVSRQNDEAARQNDEASRQNNDASRQNDEASRQIEDASRQNDDASRQNDEASQQNDDASRQSGEASRQHGEASRQNDEASRQIVEDSAQNAEGSNISVEDLVGEDAKLGVEAARISSRSSGDTSHTTRSDVAELADVPKAPFYGTKVVEITDLTKVFDFINETALFKGQWQYKQGKSSAEEYEELRRSTILPKFEEIKTKAIREKLLEAKLVYGYFPCNSDGNDLIIWHDDLKTERMRFNFPRQPQEQRGGKNLCLADYFRNADALVRNKWNADALVRNEGDARTKEADEGVRVPDVVAFQLVTMGRRASEHSAELFKADNYQDYLLFHGLSVESAEALAEMWHKRIREELGIAAADAPEMTKLFHQGYQGSRYSFGYPACPRIEDQTKLFELLDPSRIGVELTDEFMLEPEQSTSAIIVHHPEAKYFNVE